MSWFLKMCDSNMHGDSIKIQTLHFMEICQVKAELFHENRQTDRHTDTLTLLIGAFSKFVKETKKYTLRIVY
jgi:hypothetical protein